MEWTKYIGIVPLAVAPGIAIAIFIYFRDKYEKEPFRLLLKCFLFGVLSIVPAFLIELGEGKIGFDRSGGLFMTLLFAFIGVGLVEEFSKFFFLRFAVFKKNAFNEPFDGIVYSVMIAMGFATLENVIYSMVHGWGTAVVRMFTAVPMHATCGVIMGFYVGLAKFRPVPSRFLFMGILFATIMHGAYDFFLMQQDYPALMIMAAVSLAISVTLSFLAIRSHQKNSPFKVAGKKDGSLIQEVSSQSN